MSLDFYLYHETELTEVERCSYCDGKGHTGGTPLRLFDSNITHNLNKMAEAAGIYDCLWRPDEHGFTRAGQIVPILGSGLAQC